MGGDAFAAGLIFGFLSNKDPQDSIALAVAHGALAMSTPGDAAAATLAEVERLVAGVAPRVIR